jgi:hypothetical protein
LNRTLLLTSVWLSSPVSGRRLRSAAELSEKRAAELLAINSKLTAQAYAPVCLTLRDS